MAQGTHEGWEACRAEELKDGDRIRVTLEGVVKNVCAARHVGVILVGSASSDYLDRIALNAGKLERQVRPLEVGDAALADGQPVRILAIDDVYAWVRQEDDGYHRYTVRLSVLERISDAP